MCSSQAPPLRNLATGILGARQKESCASQDLITKSYLLGICEIAD